MNSNKRDMTKEELETVSWKWWSELGVSGRYKIGARNNGKTLSEIYLAENPTPAPVAEQMYTKDELKRALELQIEECAQHTQRCARDKGQASFEMNEWIQSTPIVDYVFKDPEAEQDWAHNNRVVAELPKEGRGESEGS